MYYCTRAVQSCKVILAVTASADINEQGAGKHEYRVLTAVCQEGAKQLLYK